MYMSSFKEVFKFASKCKIDEKGYFNIFAMFVGSPRYLFYDSCPDDSCKKKAIGYPPHRCSKCN